MAFRPSMATSSPAAHHSRRQRGEWERSLANLSHGLLGGEFGFLWIKSSLSGLARASPSVATGHKHL